MIKTFKFIRHAIVKRDFELAVKQIHCTGKAMQTWNGVVAMNHPTNIKDKFSVSSDKLIKAVEVCDYAATLRFTKKTMVVEKGPIKIYIPYTTDFTPFKPIKNNKIKVPDNFIDRLSMIAPFISEDASRSWSMTIRIEDGYAYATNNIIIARVKVDLPNLTIPFDVAVILLKIKTNPRFLYFNDKMIRLDYSKKTWIQGLQMIETWPSFTELFTRFKKFWPFPNEFDKILEKVNHFCPDDTVEIKDKKLITDEAEWNNIDLPDSIFSCTNMRKVLTRFDKADMRSELFGLKGKDIQGVMAGKAK